MNLFNSHNRSNLLKTLSEHEYDILIIGGGITGAGIALDAAARGLKVALVEKNDFASGTSSKSTKLIHGGLRYLKQFEIGLVREVGSERAVVHRNVPHLVRSEKMLLPLIKNGTYGKILTSFGLMVYDVLAGVEKADQREMMSKSKTLEVEPLLDKNKIEGGGIYSEYRTDDARLTIEVLKTAAKHEAHIINYCEATEFLYNENQQLVGVEIVDRLSQVKNTIKAKKVISATGPWVDGLRVKNKSMNNKHLHLTKGVHIVVPHTKFPIRQSVYFDVPDGRMIFAIPRGRVTYIGTTDTDYFGDLENIRTEEKEVHYLINGIKNIFPSINLSIKDVESSWAGLRPLINEEGKSASELSRKDEIFESDSGLLSIAGGKLTGYRKMAERVVDRAVKDLNYKSIGKCKTAKIRIVGSDFKNDNDIKGFEKEIENRLIKMNLNSSFAKYLVGTYGVQTNEIISGIDKFMQHDDIEVCLTLSELQFTIENEAVHSIVDFFERRTSRIFFDINSIEKLTAPVMMYLSNSFKWSKERLSHEKKWLKESIEKARTFI